MAVIDKTSPMPYYSQLAELLRHEISEQQEHGSVYQLASENELAELHGITRATVRHALAVLESEGWIYREWGVGTFAAIRRIEHDLTALVSTTEDMRRRGWLLTTKVISIEETPAAHYIAHPLEIPNGAPVYQLSRLRLVEGEPLSLQYAHLPTELCPGLEQHDLTQSLYGLLESRYGLTLWTARETLWARCATSEEAKLLEIEDSSPVMYMARVTYAANGVAVEYLDAVWRGDRYDFTVCLARP